MFLANFDLNIYDLNLLKGFFGGKNDPDLINFENNNNPNHQIYMMSSWKQPRIAYQLQPKIILFIKKIEISKKKVKNIYFGEGEIIQEYSTC